MASFGHEDSTKEEDEVDGVVFRGSIVALVCSVASAATAAYACTNQLLHLFAPELGWLLLVPAVLIFLLAVVGLFASRRRLHDFFRVQLAVFFMVLAAVLAGAGCFAMFSANAISHWLLNGCEGHELRGTWSDAGRLETKMQWLDGNYSQLRTGLEACRALNPLVFDLAACGIRARLPLGGEASEVHFFRWFEHMQKTLQCGGFCRGEVPLFGLTQLPETLTSRDACIEVAGDWLESMGLRLCLFVGLLAGIVLAVSLVLLGSTVSSDREYCEVDSSDPEEDGASLTAEHG